MGATLREQFTRKKPISAAGMHDHAGPDLERSLGTFSLMMFGVGATVGTGIFFVLSSAVPEAGPAVIVSFLLAGLAAGLAAGGALPLHAAAGSMVALAPALAGMALGGWVRGRVRPEVFRVLFFAGLFVLGGEALVRGLTRHAP